ncbi:SRPBCC family protein [Solirubrobacter taibaiensis]|nr:SRPBCC family protein [Solirubrobacter taibaiensis]
MSDRDRAEYDRVVFIDRSPDAVFEFCRQGENFAKISPERITPTRATRDTVVKPGGTYVFRHWISNVIPMRWRVEIVDYEYGHHYVDFQRRGPFRYFRHTHTCEPEGSGTKYSDRVEFESYFGPRVDRLIKRRLASVFAHRQREMKRLLEDEP